MSCWLFHKWDQWSAPYDVKVWNTAFGHRIAGSDRIGQVQERECQRCGKIEQRLVAG